MVVRVIAGLITVTVMIMSLIHKHPAYINLVYIAFAWCLYLFSLRKECDKVICGDILTGPESQKLVFYGMIGLVFVELCNSYHLIHNHNVVGGIIAGIICIVFVFVAYENRKYAAR